MIAAKHVQCRRTEAPGDRAKNRRRVALYQADSSLARTSPRAMRGGTCTIETARSRTVIAMSRAVNHVGAGARFLVGAPVASRPARTTQDFPDESPIRMRRRSSRPSLWWRTPCECALGLLRRTVELSLVRRAGGARHSQRPRGRVAGRPAPCVRPARSRGYRPSPYTRRASHTPCIP